MKNFISKNPFLFLVVIPAFFAAILFATAEYVDNHTFFKIQVGAAWVITAWVVGFLAYNFFYGFFQKLFSNIFKKKN